jgi:hypothetical protein
MVMFLERPRLDLTSKARGGEETSAVDIFAATDEDTRLGHNAVSGALATDRAYDDWIDEIKKQTGAELRNPLSQAEDPRDVYYPRPDRPAYDPYAVFRKQREDLSEQQPEHRDFLLQDRDVNAAGERKVGGAERASEEAWERSDKGAAAWAARLAGGFYGAMHDPIQWPLMAIGPTAKAGAGAKGLLWMGLKQGAANAAGEAAIQPFVQQWRKKAGVDYGLGYAAVDIGAAGAFGLGLDVAVRSGVRGYKRARGRPYLGPDEPAPDGAEPTGARLPGLPEGRQPGGEAPEAPAPRVYRGADPIPPMEALEQAARNAPEGSVLRRAADGDEDAMRELAKELGPDADPAIRRALDEIEIEKLFPTPLDVDDGAHLEALARAIRHESGAADLPAGDAISAPIRRDVANLADEAVGRALDVEGRPVGFRPIDPRTVSTDASTFQFKSGGDTAGVTDRLRGVTRWDPVSAGKAIVFERADGQMVIADGHQRLGLAKRVASEGQDAKLDAYVFREADGWTPEDVRAYAALKNMRESSGTSIDMAQVMRDRPDLIDGSLPLTDAKLRDAAMLARLSPEAFDAVVAGRLPPPFAALIGESVADATRHAGLLDEMAAAGLANTQQARLYLKQLMELPTTVETQMTLFGEESFTRTVLIERAQVLDSALRTLKADKRIFGLLRDQARAIEGAGNVLARDANQAKAESAAQLAELIEKLATSRGTVATILNDAAASVARGLDPKLASRAFVDRIADTLEREGLPGLVRVDEAPKPDLAPVRMDDPMGPEAKAQAEDVEAWLADAREAAERLDAARAKTQTEIDLDDEIMFALRAKRYAAPDVATPEDIGDALKSIRETVADAQTAPLTGRFAPDDLRARFIAYKKADTDLRAALISGLDGQDALGRYAKLRGEAEALVNDMRKTDARINRDIEKDMKAREGSADDAMFALRQASQPPVPPRNATLHNTTLSARASEQMASVRAEIDKAVAKSLPAGWRAEVRQSLVFGDLSERIQKRNPGVPPSLEIEGTFDPYEKIIYVSMAALDPVERAFEEAGHAIKAMRLIPQSDYGILQAKALEIGARAKFRIDERYGDVYGARWKDNPARLEEALEEEAIMQMVAARARGDDFGKQSNAILDKLIKFLRAVRDMLGIKGFRSFDDVFEDMTEGGFARQMDAQRGGADAGRAIGGEVMAGGPGKTADAAAGASITQTPAFRKWFGGSKVVDESGRPLVVYHGTDSDVEAFDPAKQGEATDAPSARMGFFFAADPAVASSYASSPNFYKDDAFGRVANKLTRGWYEKANEALLRKLGLRSVAGGGENVLPVHLKIERPFEFDMKGQEYRERSFAEIIDQAKRDGHDGVIIRNTFDEGFEEGGAKMTDVYVAFAPTQIKSAIGNRGTFDPNDPRISFSIREPESPTATDASFIARAEAASEIMFALGDEGKGKTPEGKSPEAKSPEAGGEASPKTPRSGAEPPVPAGKVRVYHSGAPLSATGESKRWVSTNRQYAKDYRKGQPLHYLDLEASDPRVNNADYPDQGVAQGFQFNFELSEAESGRLRQIADADSPASTGGAQAAAAPSPSAPAKTSAPILPGGRESKRIRNLINQAAAEGKLPREDADAYIARYDMLEQFYKDGGKAKQQIAKELTAEAEKRKANKDLAELKRRILVGFLTGVRDARGQADPAKAYQALIENLGQLELPQGFVDVAGHQRAIYGMALAQLDAMLHEFKGVDFSPSGVKVALTGATRNKARLSNVVRELHGEATGDELAAGFAQAAAKVMEDLRMRFNAAGGSIAKRKDWAMPQSHDKVALLKAKKDAWVEFITPLLDTKWMKHPLTGDDMPPADVRKTLGDVYDNLVADGWHEREAEMVKRGLSAISNTRADPRSLIFANADAWMKYSARFGSGDDALAILISHIRGMTKDIAAMEVLGPNPTAMLEYIRQFVVQQASLRRAGMPAHFPTHREITGIEFKPGSRFLDPLAYANAMTKRAENMWRIYTGAASAPESPGWAEVSTTIKNVNVATKLGGAFVSGLGDPFWQIAARKFAGLPAVKMFPEILNQIKAGGEREARRSGVIAETFLHMHNEGAREGAAWSASKVSGYVADRVLTLSMLSSLTRAGNHAMSMGIQSHLADMAGKAFPELDPRLQRMFRRWGLEATDWDAIRLDAGGRARDVDFLSPADIRRQLVDNGGDPSIAERYLAMALGEAQYATLTGTITAQARVYGNLQAGTWQREMWSLLMQFKSFAVNLAILQISRMAREFVSQGFSRGAQYAFLAVGMATLGGALVEQLQQLRNGKDPRAMTTPEFWGAAVYRSGGLSIWGDLLYASENRFGGGVASTIAGPSASTLNDLLNLTYGSAKKSILFGDGKEETNFGRQLSSAVSRYTPGSSIWYLRTAWERVLMDNLQRMLDPEADASFRRKIQNARRDYKQEFWWKPGGGAVPQRGPRLDAVLPSR